MTRRPPPSRAGGASPVGWDDAFEQSAKADFVPFQPRVSNPGTDGGVSRVSHLRTMPESFKTRLTRIAYTYLFPAYRGTGGRITYVADDWREVRVEVPLSRRTKNYVGTIFGGSMYGAVDPIHMVMLIKALGPGYVVWDKAGTIRFRKPGRTTLHARFTLDDA